MSCSCVFVKPGAGGYNLTLSTQSQPSFDLGTVALLGAVFSDVSGIVSDILGGGGRLDVSLLDMGVNRGIGSPLFCKFSVALLPRARTVLWSCSLCMFLSLSAVIAPAYTKHAELYCSGAQQVPAAVNSTGFAIAKMDIDQNNNYVWLFHDVFL